MINWFKKKSADPFVLYQSRYQEYFYNPHLEIYEEIWNSETSGLTNEKYKKEFLAVLGAIRKNGLPAPYSKLLIDHREFDFPINTDLQEWHAKYIFSEALKFIDKKLFIANIVTPKTLIQWSIEQTFDEWIEFSQTSEHYESKFFSDREEALAWLRIQSADEA